MLEILRRKGVEAMILHIPDEMMQKQIASEIVAIATAEIEKRMKLLTKTIELPPYGNKETIKQVLGIGDKKLNKWISMGLKIQVWSPQDIRIERNSLQQFLKENFEV